MPLDQAYVIPDEVVSRQVGDETVILNVETGMYYGLDDVGTRIWQLLSEGRSAAQIQGQLALEFHAEDAQIASDLAALLSTLVDKGLVRTAD